MKSNGLICSLIFQMLIILACFAISNYAVQSDIDCLRSIKESLEDPHNLLSSWDFNNSAYGFICFFSGVECWHPEESRVLNLHLPDMGLSGPFPIGLTNCTSLTGLDLSGNKLTGDIPSNVTDFIQFVTFLDLSNNHLSGPIPRSFANLSFLNVLRLNDNQLTGQIPPELGKLDRIKEFSVANNRLTGQVPLFTNYSSSEECYANNLGLCGGPLSPCKIENHDHHHIFFSGFVVGFPVFFTLTSLIVNCCLPVLSMKNTRSFLLMIKKIKGRKHQPIPRISKFVFTDENITEESKITTLEKHVRRVTLEELKLATNDFDTRNEIGYGNMGLMYKAVFPNGLVLAVKRLHKFESFDKEFSQEIEILGRLRQVNLVPILCFCFEMGKKFIVYRYMSNGTLHQWLHSRPQVEGMKMGWSLRLRIAVGIARGLAWLHHNNVLRVAHLSINSKCILLDDNFEPKISNFGNSNILMNTSGTLSSSCTFLVPDSSSDPYKVDVYSFGVLLLELVSGRERSPVDTNIDNLRDNIGVEELDLIDECLIGQGFDDEIYETLNIVENCVQTHKKETKSMLQVYQAIRTIGISRKGISVDPCMDLEDLEGKEGDV